MKKVFSKEKYIEDRRSDGLPEEDIQHHLNSWANKCEGLTLEEMLSRGCYADHDWLIEVPDEEELTYEKLKEENQKLKKQVEKYKKKLMIITKMEIKEIDENTFVGIDYYVEKCVSLQKEHQELKKQLEVEKERVEYLRRSVERKEEKIDDLEEERIPYTNECVKKLENQQKEFIELLKTSIANCNKYLNNKDNDWDEDGRGLALTRKFAYEEILSKYKEIIGGK